MESGLPTATVIAGDLTAMTIDAAAPRGPAVLFVHGLFGGAWQFEGWQPRMAARGFPNTAINLRGHHGSRPVPHLGSVSLLEYVDDAHAAAAALGKPIVVGHSMGGLIAQKLAESDAVRAAVLICAAPPRGISVVSPSLLVRQIKHAPSLLLSRPIETDPDDAESLLLNRVPPDRHAGIMARLVPDSGRAGRELSLGEIAVDERRVRCPVLSIGCTDDRFVVPRIARALARKYGATWRELAGHGHYVIGEPGWEVVADGVAEWMRDVTAEA